MRYPQVLVWEGDGRLAALLRPAAEANGWALHEPRQVGPCLRLLRRGRPGVLVLRLGRDLERELSLLDHVSWHCPGASTVVVLDSDHPRLAGLAFDLGAAWALLPPFSGERLLEVVLGLMGSPAGQGAP
jgi:hypothetical protein